MTIALASTFADYSYNPESKQEHVQIHSFLVATFWRAAR